MFGTHHDDQEPVSSVSSFHKTSLFVHHPRLIDTQSPDADFAVLYFEALTKWKAILLSLHLRQESLRFVCQTCHVPVLRDSRHPVGVAIEWIHRIG